MNNNIEGAIAKTFLDQKKHQKDKSNQKEDEDD